MVKTTNGNLDAKGRTFAVVVSRFNSYITGKLLDGALDALRRHGAEEDRIHVVYVPGAFEIPLAARALTRHADAVLCLGAVIRGDTPHFDYVAAESARGIADAARDSGKPVINGVLTTNTVEQAVERAGAKSGNKGWDAALAAIEMAGVMAQLGHDGDTSRPERGPKRTT